MCHCERLEMHIQKERFFTFNQSSNVFADTLIQWKIKLISSCVKLNSKQIVAINNNKNEKTQMMTHSRVRCMNQNKVLTHLID